MTLCGMRAWLVSLWGTGSHLASRVAELNNTHAWPLPQSAWSILYGAVVKATQDQVDPQPGAG